MKKYFAIVVGLFLIAGCTNDSLDDNVGVNEGMKSFTTFTASIDDVAGTRAYLDAEATNSVRRVHWEKGDVVSVYSDIDPELKQFVLTGLNENGEGTFIGEKIKGNKFFAVFAPNKEITVDVSDPNVVHLTGDVFNKNMMADQNTAVNFTAPMVASTTGSSFSFKQITGLVKITVGNIHQVDDLFFRDSNLEPIGDDYLVDVSKDQPVLKLDEGANTVSFDQIITNLEEKFVDVYFVLPPMVFNDGFLLTISGIDAQGNKFEIDKNYASRFEVKAASISSFSLVDLKAELEALDDGSVIIPSDDCADFFEQGITMSALETSKKIRFTTNKNWTVSVKSATEELFDAIWYCVDEMSGVEGEAELTITLDENYGGDDREFVFTIKAGNATKDIRVVQKLLPDSELPNFLFVPFKINPEKPFVIPDYGDKDNGEKFLKDIDELQGLIDFGFLGRNGINYFYKFQDYNPNIPEQLIVYNSVKETVPVVVDFDFSGMPYQIVSEESKILLSNLNGNTFDAEIITSSGEYLKLNNIEIEGTWEEYSDAIRLPIMDDRQLTHGTDVDHLFTTQTKLGTLSCALSIASAPTGIGLGLTLISCAGAFDSIMDDLSNKYPMVMKIDDFLVNSPILTRLARLYPNNPIQLYRTFRMIGNFVNNPIGDAVGLLSCIPPILQKKVFSFLSCVASGVKVAWNIKDFHNNKFIMYMRMLQEKKQNKNANMQVILLWDKKQMNLGLGVGNPHGYYGYFRGASMWQPQYHGYVSNNDVTVSESFAGTQNVTKESVIYNRYIYPGIYSIEIHYEGPYAYGYTDDHSGVNYTLGIFKGGKGYILPGVISGNYKYYEVTVNGDYSLTLDKKP